MNIKKILYGAAAACGARMVIGSKFGLIQDAGIGYAIGGNEGAIGGVIAPMLLGSLGQTNTTNNAVLGTVLG